MTDQEVVDIVVTSLPIMQSPPIVAEPFLGDVTGQYLPLWSPKLSRLNQKKKCEYTQLSKRIDLAIKILLAKKSAGLDSFTDEFYITFKKELTSTLLKCFYKVEENVPNHSETIITFIPKLAKDTTQNHKTTLQMSVLY